MALNEQAGRLIGRSAREARRLAAAARASGCGRPGEAESRQASRGTGVALWQGRRAVDRRGRGLKITDRLVSIADPDARPIRKGKLGKSTLGRYPRLCRYRASGGGERSVSVAVRWLGRPACRHSSLARLSHSDRGAPLGVVGG
jgi:hypothetical protein